MKDLLTAKELTVRLGLDVSSVHRWLRRHGVKPERFLVVEGSRGQRVSFFDRKAVERIIQDTYGER